MPLIITSNRTGTRNTAVFEFMMLRLVRLSSYCCSSFSICWELWLIFMVSVLFYNLKLFIAFHDVMSLAIRRIEGPKWWCQQHRFLSLHGFCGARDSNYKLQGLSQLGFGWITWAFNSDWLNGGQIIFYPYCVIKPNWYLWLGLLPPPLLWPFLVDI